MTSLFCKESTAAFEAQEKTIKKLKKRVAKLEAVTKDSSAASSNGSARNRTLRSRRTHKAH